MQASLGNLKMEEAIHGMWDINELQTEADM